MKGPATASKKPRGVQSGASCFFARHHLSPRTGSAASKVGGNADAHEHAIDHIGRVPADALRRSAG